MCLLLIALNAHPDYKVVIAGNRDEFYQRPTAPAAFWQEAPNLLAGKDLVAGGTWLGVTRQGRFAGITNYRNPSLLKKNPPSRGKLTQHFLLSDDSPLNYIQRVSPDMDQFNGFNLILGRGDEFYWYSNMAKDPVRLSPGIYGLSNHLLDTPWPKVVRTKQALEILLRKTGPLVPEDILALLADRSIPDDRELPDTGVGIQLERVLSAVFIRSPDYGTRSSTLLWIDAQDCVTFMERAFAQDADRFTTRHFKFQIES